MITTTKPAPAGCCRPGGTGHNTGNQVPDVETFAAHHGYELVGSPTSRTPAARTRSGYVAAWEQGGARREVEDRRGEQT